MDQQALMQEVEAIKATADRITQLFDKEIEQLNRLADMVRQTNSIARRQLDDLRDIREAGL